MDFATYTDSFSTYFSSSDGDHDMKWVLFVHLPPARDFNPLQGTEQEDKKKSSHKHKKHDLDDDSDD